MSEHASFHTKLGDDGRIVIPSQCRKKFHLQPGDTLVVDTDEQGMRLRSMDQVVKELQAHFAPYRKPGVSVVDELIAERRAEAAKEEAELATSIAEHSHD